MRADHDSPHCPSLSRGPCARHPSELRRDQPRRALDRARPGRGAGDDRGAAGRGRRRRPGPTRGRHRTRQVQTRSRPAAAQEAIANGTATGTYVGPFGNERWVGVFGTHTAAGYGYPYPAAPDCNEGSLGAGCVGDSRGFLQGQCTSWVAYRLAMRNGLSFSNWYAGRHWGNASEWGKVAKGIGNKPDKNPAVGAIGWYKRGHVAYVEDVYSSGTILISEMNTDGHNGFHFATVSPGMQQLPRQVHPPRRRRPGRHHSADRADRRTSLPPTAGGPASAGGLERRLRRRRLPGDPQRGAARDRARHVVPRRQPASAGTPRSTRSWPSTPPATPQPGRRRCAPGHRVGRPRLGRDLGAVPRCAGGPGTTKRQRLGCRLLVDGGWRDGRADRRTAWGDPSAGRSSPAPTAACPTAARSAARPEGSRAPPSTGAREWGTTGPPGARPRLASPTPPG